MRSVWHWGWLPFSVTAWAVACGSSGDDPPVGSTGGSGPSSGGAGTGGQAATGGSSAGTGGSSTGGSSTGGSSTGGSSLGGTAGTAAFAGAGAGGEEPGEMQACATSKQEAKLTPANLLFLIDKSGSMNCNPPEGDATLNERCSYKPIQEDMSKPTKWEVASSALSGALNKLVDQTNIRAGLTLFPIADECGVSADPAVDIAKLDSDQRATIAGELDGVSPAGETPIAGATILSYQHLSDAIRERKLVGNTFVVLLTDGAETCKESELDKLVTTDVPNARLFNIRTFVIGAPGSEQARSLLSRIAWEGGTAAKSSCNHDTDPPDEGDCHFDMTTSQDFATDLDAALYDITHDKVLSCEFDVPRNEDGRGVDFSKVNVIFEPGKGEEETIGFDDMATSCDEADGWMYSDDRTKILLCGDACERVQGDPDGVVRITLGCPTIRIVR
ncbi:MAG TPA: vWA domain-containing protein [Polyangiaceae bacterium]|nr:vWA domain-containing protein [Polyangiaceae bacterium]